MGMTVGRVYWLFDAMVAHIRLTSPFGSGDADDETASGASAPAARVTETSGFGLAQAVAGSGLNRGPTGIQTFKSIDDVAKIDPELADFARAYTEG